MRKYLKMNVLAAACIAAVSSAAGAAEVVTDFDIESGIGTVKFTGNVAIEQEVSLSIFYPEKDKNADGISWAAQNLSGTDGKTEFTFSVLPGSPTGWYTGVVKSDKIKKHDEIRFYYLGNASSIVSEFKALSTDNTAAFITKYTQEEPVLSTEYTEIPAADILAPYVYTLKEENNIVSFADVNGLYNLSIVMSFINNAEDIEQLDVILKENADIIGFEADEDYEKYKSDICSAVFAQTQKDGGLKSHKTLIDTINTTRTLKALNDASKTGITSEVESVIKKYASNLGVNTEEYSKYNSSVFNRALVNKIYNSIDDFKKAYDDRKKEMDSNTGGSSQGSSGSGGGGGGGSSTGTGGVSVTSVPKQTVTEQGLGFIDMESAEWAKEAVTYLYNKGIVAGIDAKHFAPDMSITREQFVKMLVEAFGLEKADAKSKFDDVDENEWYYFYISSAHESGVVNGVSEDIFGVGQNITRQDMAVMLYRCAVLKGYSFNSAELMFTDSDSIADYAHEAVGGLVECGAISGFEDGSFEPHGLCTRAQAAKVLYVLLKQEG